MNKKLIVATLLIALTASLVVVGLTYAQANGPQPSAQPGFGFGEGRLGDGYGMRLGQAYTGTMPLGGGMLRGQRGGWADSETAGPMHDTMMTVLAGALGLTPEELDSRIASGETPYAIAMEQGLTLEQFSEVMQGARAAAIEQRIADGTLTREQADWMLSHMGGRGGSMVGNRGFVGNCPHLAPQTNP